MKVSELTPSQLVRLTTFLYETPPLSNEQIEKCLAWFEYKDIEVYALKDAEVYGNTLSIDNEEYKIFNDSEFFKHLVEKYLLREKIKMIYLN
jgi:hypothetical protein